MGLIKAAVGAVGGTLADQWRDFLTIPPYLEPTAALVPAVPVGTNSGRGSNIQRSQAIMTNGSRVVVPEGYGLLLFQDGGLTGFASEPGAYIWNSEDLYSQSLFASEKVRTSLVTQSWERFKFGGRPGSQQLALFVSLKELPNNKFGTQSEVYWDDAYFNTQVSARTHGTFSIHIMDPILFVKQFVPATYLQGQDIFDFTDPTNAASNQLFAEVVSSLAPAFSVYSNDPDKGNRIANIQRDSVGFAQSLSQAVDDAYRWRSTRGIAISKVTIIGIDYDHETKELLKTIQRADALAGPRGKVNLQASAAAGIEAAGKHAGTGGILGMGMAAGSIGLADLVRDEPPPNAAGNASPGGPDLVARLEGLKRALDAGLIDQSEYDAARAKALGLA